MTVIMMPKIVIDPDFGGEVVQELNFDSLSDDGDTPLNDSDDSAIGHNFSLDSSGDCEIGHQGALIGNFLKEPEPHEKSLAFQDIDSKRWTHCFQVDDIKPIDKRTCVTTSPPYKKFRRLLLNSQMNTTPRASRRRHPMTHRTIWSDSQCLKRSTGEKETGGKDKVPVMANVNPYTPNHQKAPEIKVNSCGEGVTSNCSMSSSNYVLLGSEKGKVVPLKNLRVSQSNVSRYKQEFLQLEMIGSGVHGQVYKCLNRLDGCVYAVKRTVNPMSHKLDENTAMKEVYAHAVLGTHPHIVRYFSSWAEEGRVNIQNEFCNGGSLESMLPSEFTEDQLRTILLHVADGLRYIHSLGLVHLDIKPENVFISRDIGTINSCDLANSSFKDDAPVEITVSYKIGDLGHVTSIAKPQVEDGDCRYLAKELLNDDYTCLPKSDIFALGLMIFELASGESLPKNGDRWHELRRSLPVLSSLSSQLNELLKAMVSPDPSERPTTSQIMQSLSYQTEASASELVMRQQVEEEKLKNSKLTQQLDTAMKCLSSYVKDKKPPVTRSCRQEEKQKF